MAPKSEGVDVCMYISCIAFAHYRSGYYRSNCELKKRFAIDG